MKTGTILVDGKPVEVGISNTGFLKIERVWGTSTVTVTFEKQLRREALPGDPSRFALLDGPIVLAALGSDEPELGAKAVVIPRYEHQYIEGRDWQSSHYSVRGSHGLVELRPLYESADEHYLVFFHTAE